ncbi:protein kinase domain-containing protein [Pseudoxanthomonas winnipegensis]|uniref:serine/threonine-protein kinase n=1 Tax=Pseudoxanthomonas winnipegensis TaxID=2480810 RepID=UPI003F854FE1
MTQSDGQGVHALLEQLLALPPAQRQAALARACEGRPDLLERLQRLLALAEGDDGFLDRSPFGEGAAHEADPRTPGRVVGPYRLLRWLGAGGMAQVWLAERIAGGFRQQVAIKLIAQMPDPLQGRLSAERDILASLVHPGIARLYDGGVTDEGLAWMAMEYVQGQDLVSWCQARHSGVAERLALFLQVCDAVAYAHTRLVVHRDIKPANILVTDDGQARLLDFGLARLLEDAPGGAAPSTTRTLQLSPSYAAPEQLDGGLVGTATDVYALGVTLYELLAGRLPWALQGSALATAVRRLAAAEPPPPSRAVAADGLIPARALRGDLDAIVARAMRPAAEQRYPDARALAEDIRRHLEHRPVLARAGARSYQARRYVRRHWRGLALVGVAFLALGTGLVTLAWQERRTEREAQRAAAMQAFMVDLFRTNTSRQADPVRARQTTARELLDIGAARIQSELDQAPENKLALLRLFGNLYDEFALSAEQLPMRQQAVALSRQLYGPDSVELASDLIAQARISFSDHDQAEALLAQARAILDRQGDTRSQLRGRLLIASAANNYTNDPGRALDDATQAAAVLSAYPPSSELARALQLQGVATAYRGKTAEAVPVLRRSVQVSIQADGDPNPALAGYYIQLGETESYAYEHAAAEADLRRGIQRAEGSTAENDLALVRARATLAVALVNADRAREGLVEAALARAAAPRQDTGPEALFLTIQTLSTSSRAKVRAGDPAAALIDARQAVRLARQADPGGTVLTSNLQREAEALVELGRYDEARQRLDECDRLMDALGTPGPNDFNMLLRVRALLAQGQLAQAQAGYARLKPPSGDGPKAQTRRLQRALAEAELALAGGDAAGAATRAHAATEAARTSALAPFLRSMIADGQLLEGRAALAQGDAGAAARLLDASLALRRTLDLPQSPRIAQAQQLLAQAQRKSGAPTKGTRLALQG